MDINFMETRFGLKGYDLLVFNIVQDFTKKFGGYDMGNKYLAERIQCEKWEADKQLKKLVKQGLIEKTKTVKQTKNGDKAVDCYRTKNDSFYLMKASDTDDVFKKMFNIE